MTKKRDGVCVCCNSFAGHMRTQSHFDRYFLRCVYERKNKHTNTHGRHEIKTKIWA